MNIDCPACGMSVRVPVNAGKSAIRCPFCKATLAPNIGAGGLGDYPANLPYRVILTKGGQAFGQTVAPIEQEEETCTLLDICKLLKAMPWMMVMEARKQLMLPGRDAQYFIKQSVGAITVPTSGAVTQVVEYSSTEKFGGALLGVGAQVITLGAADSISWTLRVNGQVHPDFAGVVLNTPTTQMPLQFKMELVQGRTIELIAQSSNAAPVLVTGYLLGFTEFLTESKEWGTSPSSGIG